jgi:pyridoxamine 5'-phosphate oxidase
MRKKDLTTLRQEYAGEPLQEQAVDPDPYIQFVSWFDQALAAGLTEPNAMTLATITTDGRPTARVVLLKELDGKGFVFYTNFQSNKGKELIKNPHASAVFLWLELQRQVRIEGVVQQVGDDISDAYFLSRPFESQLGAVASPQSAVIPSRKYLEDRFAVARSAYENKPLRRPAHWGGFRLLPEKMEFWQGRPNRLHDRLLYVHQEPGWQISRLAP